MHLSQADLASALKVSRSQVSDWENDRARPRHIYRVEQVLGVDLTSAGESPHPEYADPVLQELWEKLQSINLTETTRRTLVEYCSFLRTREAGRRREGA